MKNKKLSTGAVFVMQMPSLNVPGAMGICSVKSVYLRDMLVLKQALRREGINGQDIVGESELQRKEKVKMMLAAHDCGSLPVLSLVSSFPFSCLFFFLPLAFVSGVLVCVYKIAVLYKATRYISSASKHAI